jgi:hypothetical protein
MQQEQYIQINKNGNKIYYKNRAMTILHRLDGPAIECADGGKIWHIEGKRHRLDGPAVEYSGGYKAWYVDGKLHRLDGPAIECADGYKLWYVDDKRHRLDGPAIECADGYKVWYVDDKRLTEEQFNALTAPVLELTLEEITDNFGVDVSKIKIKK